MKFGLLLMAVILAFGPGPAATAEDRPEQAARKAAPTIRAPKEAVEGDRIALKVRVPAARTAKSVRLETHQKNIYGNVEWVPVRRSAVRKARVVLRATVTESNRQRVRAVVTYKNETVVRSRPTSVKVWRWVPISAFRPYYSTQGVSAHQYSQFPMNGREYLGWYTYYTNESWESRHTLGRHCTTLRGDFGVHDSSSDGSTGRIQVQADDRAVFDSSTLSPGMTQTATISLGQPYRVSIIATDTSTGANMQAYPAIGSPEFLCTGL